MRGLAGVGKEASAKMRGLWCALAGLDSGVVGKAEEMTSAFVPCPVESPSFFPLLVCVLDGPNLALWLGLSIYTISWPTNDFPDSKVCSLVSLMGDWGLLSLLRRFLNAACTSCNTIC